MPGPPVTLGAAVIVTPGAAGPPDSGVITVILPPLVLTNQVPLATSGSICTMVNSLTGAPYPLIIGPPASSQVYVGGRSLVRIGDRIPSPPGILTILGPPVVPNVLDNSPPQYIVIVHEIGRENDPVHIGSDFVDGVTLDSKAPRIRAGSGLDGFFGTVKGQTERVRALQCRRASGATVDLG